MANNIITTSIFAKAAVKILDNELGLGSRVFRGYEEEFGKNVNGYKAGQTISIRKPNQASVRVGASASPQDVVEGSLNMTIKPQIGYDFKLTSRELTLNIGEIADRIIKPAMVQIANYIDRDLHTTAMTSFWNWVGTPGNSIANYTKFLAGVQRLNEMAVPQDERFAALSPADHVALLGSQSALYINGAANDAYRNANLGGLAGVDPFMTQNAPILTTGSRTNGTVAGANQNVTYAGAQANSWGQTLNVAGLGASASVKAGEVFTLAGVFAVNPVTKQALPYLQQFVVTADASADGAGAAALSVSPAIITSGPFQTVTAAPANGAVLTWLGTASTSYQQNIMFHKNALALAVVPMEKPAGAVDVSRESYKNLSVRVVPYYDGANDVSNWRLDVLYATAAVDPRLGTRING